MTETSKHEIKLFYCYAHEDKALCIELEKHLSPLKRQYLIKSWHDREIIPGEEWEQAIDRNLNTSHLILLLISPDFMHSDYCYSKEMVKALEREKAGACRVVPILLRSVDLEGAPFSHLQMLPTGARPVTSWPDSDQAFWNIALGVRKVLQDLLQSLKTKEERLEEVNLSHHLSRSEKAPDNAPVPTTEKRNLSIIDLSIEAALEIEADHHPISLTQLHNTYLRANPGIRKGTTRNSFDAVINYHTINMRSRFHYPNDKRKSDTWLSRPVFKRVAPARYMLLLPEEVALFRHRIEEGDPRVYQDEYNVDDLIQPQGDIRKN
jgi:hypothetical protein